MPSLRHATLLARLPVRLRSPTCWFARACWTVLGLRSTSCVRWRHSSLSVLASSTSTSPARTAPSLSTASSSPCVRLTNASFSRMVVPRPIRTRTAPLTVRTTSTRLLLRTTRSTRMPPLRLLRSTPTSTVTSRTSTAVASVARVTPVMRLQPRIMVRIRSTPSRRIAPSRWIRSSSTVLRIRTMRPSSTRR